MPRTQRSVLPFASLPTTKIESAYQVESASFSIRSLDFAHAWFLPLHYEPGYAYPLIVWLHRSGDDERQLVRVMPMVSMRNYLAVAPRGIRLGDEQPGSRECFGWMQTDEHIQQSEQRVFDCIEMAKRQYHVHPERLFLAGFDRGGTMAMRIAMNHPGRFAGAISLCGPFPKGRSPFGNLLAARRVGILLASGRSSAEYPASQVCEDLRLLHTAGLSVTVRQYPSAQELTPQMLADVDRWIIEQISRPTEPAVERDAEWSRELD
jgi:phospholipase/carboxylesterase